MSQDAQIKRILIVDDEVPVAEALAVNLEKLGPEYIVETATSGQEALNKIQHAPFALMITDYSMPNMDGLDLAEQVRQQAPDTQIVLMTAYGTDSLRTAIDQLRLAGYFEKPVSIPEIRKIVRDVLDRVHSAQPDRPDTPTMTQSVQKQLQELWSNTGARCVLLLSSGGYPVEVAGRANGLDIMSLGALIAANFLAAAELSHLLDSGSVFKSSHHEGPDYNFYAHDINGDFLLAVIYDSKTKPGVVWYYAKKTVDELAPLCVVDQTVEFESLQDWSEALDTQFEEFTAAEDEQTAPIAEPPNGSTPSGSKLSFEEALRRGMLGRELK